MSIDVSQFSPDDLAQLRALLSGGTDSFGLDALGRSPNKPRQLQNLNLAPRADDPRPTFFWSAESPRNVDTTRTTEYPKLMWHSTSGQEITVRDASAQSTQTAKGFILSPPASVVADPVDEVAALLESLSEADRKTLQASLQAARIAAVQEKMAAMTDAQIAASFAAAAPAVQAPAKKGA